ncbi:MAG: glycosyltransferase family 4 protein, partial [Chlorobi bacterium]|nr:glycosyltransferase family 4 protein [Chlorobiota bacterium]
MRVAILLLNKGRGSGEVARQHARHLIKQGHKVYFIHPGIGSGVDGAVNLDVILHTSVMPVHEYLPSAGSGQKQVARMSYEEMSAYLPDYESVLESIVQDTDIIIGHHANLSAVAVNDVATRFHKPYVIFVHGTGIEPRHHGLWDDRSWELIEKAITQAKGIIVTTEYVRDELVKPLIPLPDEKFLILPCGVDLHYFHPANTEGIREKYDLPERYVICPGALTQSKGPQNVVEASKEYAHLAPTVFIGDGELRDKLKRNLGDRGTFLGYVSEEDKAQLINAAELLTAAPEKKEHFGIIYVEALAAGTPPVAYKGGGVDSIITPDVGIITERNPETLGKKIARLL